jgi:error-prone DNA polymerase
MQVLAAANALSTLAGNRREALWQSVAAVPDKDMLTMANVQDETPVLGAPSEAEDIVGDYKSAGLTLGRHPLELLRPQLLDLRLMPAATDAAQLPQREASAGMWLGHPSPNAWNC